MRTVSLICAIVWSCLSAGEAKSAEVGAVVALVKSGVIKPLSGLQGTGAMVLYEDAGRTISIYNKGGLSLSVYIREFTPKGEQKTFLNVVDSDGDGMVDEGYGGGKYYNLAEKAGEKNRAYWQGLYDQTLASFIARYGKK